MRLSDRKGFTLLETLLASIVMAIGLFAVISAIYLQTTIINKDREHTIANLAAQGEVENIRGMKFSDIMSLTSFDEGDAPGLAYLHYGAGFGRGEINVSNADFTSDSHIKKVSVTVRWNSINGTTLHRTISTLVTENGINKQ